MFDANNHPSDVLESEWENLEDGGTLRIHCSSDTCKHKRGKALTITKIIGGCVYNCYRCGLEGYPGIISQGSNPSSALKRIKSIRDNRRQSTDPNYVVKLPIDFINLLLHTKAPSAAMAWLYVCELDVDEIYKYNIGYSCKLDRVIIPIYEHDKLIAWQGRDVYYDRNKRLFDKGILKRSPLKYYTEYNKINNNKLYFKINNNNNNNKLNKLKYNKYKYNNIIIVEDILSCIKLAKHYPYHNVVALLNSTITDTTIKDLKLRDYDSVTLWLDNDKATYAIRKVYLLRSQGINCYSIRTKMDPKNVPFKEMPVL